MTAGTILTIVLAVLLVSLVAAFLYRLRVLHRGGTAAIMRTLPAGPGSGWRHGIVRYGESTLVFFKLSSLRPGPDARLTRGGIEVTGRRSATGNEFDIMTEDTVIVELTDSADIDGERSYEIAFDVGALTAFLSWVESRPDGRSQRRRIQ
ncbi:DUF2550 family protein [Rhodococcus rhodnii]|uniref:Secreted protein n=2 Tax=Rhodococcus rhodnii TaxID=38312 RepID=R7WIB0_9NOCA|nr:DUF2550 domain-containing protein [Rhodococcus rhodnii]EOM74942.1 hypothetical protein Rrhod_3820 [Rhodococcus rhodnii LMG 5362]TXG91626.1 DUF2550 family protein [Rhodococcus rhodnii]